MTQSLTLLAALCATGKVIEEILAERRRQIELLGFTAAHDDCHRDGSLVRQAVLYARASLGERVLGLPEGWSRPDANDSPRRNLIKCLALLFAELERQDRLPLPPEDPPAT